VLKKAIFWDVMSCMLCEIWQCLMESHACVVRVGESLIDTCGNFIHTRIQCFIL
jgi:hypothetical protein